MEEILKNLESLGFTNYESKVFCVLFEGRTMTASEIAKDAKIPRTSTYDILKSFTKKGICNEISTSGPALYEIIDPQIVEDKIKKEIHDTYNSNISRLKDSFDKLKPVFKSKENPAAIREVELIKGFNQHRDLKFMELWKEASREMLLMNKLEGQIDSSVDEFSMNFMKQGGVIKTLYEVSYNFKISIEGVLHNVTENNFFEIAGGLQDDSGAVKLTDKVFQNMAIFDRKSVYVSLVNPALTKNNRSDVIIRNENYANAMADYFDECWKKSHTIEEYKKFKSRE
ncbi:hypothetical protein BH10BAC5_BH10BAC5_16500 [soil metagenome]